jgi:hypothetical protein
MTASTSAVISQRTQIFPFSTSKSSHQRRLSVSKMQMKMKLQKMTISTLRLQSQTNPIKGFKAKA